MTLLTLGTFIIAPLIAAAQTQHGYVKTKGRLATNGTVIAGTPLSGTTIIVKGGNAVVSDEMGTFTLAIPGSSYYLQDVQKQGYVLTDPDVLSKRYAYSKNPLVLVLETPSQRADDKLAVERQIRRTLQRQLQEKEDEIESLKAQQKLSDEEYRKSLQEIFDRQENNEKLISEMADRYAKMDFDEVDEFNRRISQLILEGKLTEADSLLNTKGDITIRAATLRQHQEANAQAEEELQKKQQKLEKSKELAQKELEDLAQDCFSKYEIFKMKHQNDSAAYYIELRAELDTMKYEWQDAAANFYTVYMADYDKAFALYQRTQRAIIQEMGEEFAPLCYDNFAWIYHDKGNHEQAITYFRKALDYWLLRKDKKSDDNIANCYYGIGACYTSLADYPHAIEHLKEALAYREKEENKNYVSIACTLNALGVIYSDLADYAQAQKYLMEAQDILLRNVGEDDRNLADFYQNLGVCYKRQAEYDQAIAYYKKAYALYATHYGEMHPSTIKVYANLGSLYAEKGDYPESLEWSQKALVKMLTVLGPLHPVIYQIYINIATAHGRSEDYQNALSYYHKA